MRERLRQVKAEKGGMETNQASNCTYIQVTQLVLSTHLVAKRERSPEAVGGLFCQQVCNTIAVLESYQEEFKTTPIHETVPLRPAIYSPVCLDKCPKLG